ncbi:MAG: hypothetical protein KF804_13615 [Burkholderiales bacterium]|jgi:major membrane immunogen (membrane-anchored lipoprotein)|nr:hypothetical protein [Burkholderiales bacterium]
MKKLLVSAVAGSFLLLAGCGEKTQVTVYKQGQYQGKPDKQPWDNAQFKNDRVAWEKAIRARTVGQNEYVRVSGN